MTRRPSWSRARFPGARPTGASSPVASFVRRRLRTVLLAPWFVFWLAVLAVPGTALAVDANTASADDLQTIRGIGPAMAARIVEARQQEPFRDLDDLRSRVRGIGEKNLRRMQDAGLDVGSGGEIVDASGRAQLREATAPRRAGAPRPKVEAQVDYYVGRPR